MKSCFVFFFLKEKIKEGKKLKKERNNKKE